MSGLGMVRLNQKFSGFIVSSSSFQTYVIGAEQPVGQNLTRILANLGLVYKGISLESRDKLPAMAAVRPFFVITPSLNSTDDRQHVSFWLQRAQELDACVLLLSSTAVFAYKPDNQYTEGDSEFAETDAAVALLEMERETRENHRHIILRCGQLFSIQGDDFASSLLEKGREQQAIELDMQRLLDPTPVDDIADVLLAIMRQVACSDDLYGTYHFSGVEPVSSYAFAEVLFAEAGQYEDLSDVTLQSQEGGMMPDVWAVSSDNTLLFHSFGIKPKPWRQGISRLLKRYYRVEDSEK